FRARRRRVGRRAVAICGRPGGSGRRSRRSLSRASGSHDTDVLVVGGGPAGLLAGEAAAAAGRRVVLVEREAQIAETVRTSGGMSIEAMRAFDIPTELYHPIET